MNQSIAYPRDGEVGQPLDDELDTIGCTLMDKHDDRFDPPQAIFERCNVSLAHVQPSITAPLPTSVTIPPSETIPARPMGIQQAFGPAKRHGGRRRPPRRRAILATAIAFPLILAGVLIVQKTKDDELRTGDQSLAIEQKSLAAAIREFNNLFKSDATGNLHLPLSQSEVLAALKWKLGNNSLSDEVVLATEPVLYTKERLLPAGWRFRGGQVEERCPRGIIQLWQIRLETDGLSEPIVIRNSAIGITALQQPTENRDVEKLTVSMASLVERFNSEPRLIEQPGMVPQELPPLTIDEVLAAILYSSEGNANLAISDQLTKWLPQIIATKQLPAEAQIETEATLENSIGQRFTVDLIRLKIPRANDPASFDTLPIRKRFVSPDINDSGAIHWGKPGSNGLQAGVRLIPAAEAYRHGQEVEIEFLYRSVTSRKVSASLPPAFQFAKVRGMRLERVGFLQPQWPDGSAQTLIGNEPVAVRGHRMQICFASDEEVKPGVHLRLITRPDANHYVRFTVPNVGADSDGGTLEIGERLFFSILPLTPPKDLPLYESHYYQHWGSVVPNHRLPTESTPDPDYVDPFQIGASLGPADIRRIPAYYSSGLQVMKVAPYSPAESAGIEVGDILLSWEGNQIQGADPTKPFARYDAPNSQLRKMLESMRYSRGWGSFNMDFDLLDHRTGEVIRISPWFGMVANGGPTKAETLKQLEQRKQLRKANP